MSSIPLYHAVHLYGKYCICIHNVWIRACPIASNWKKTAVVSNDVNNGSVPSLCPSEPWQVGSHCASAVRRQQSEGSQLSFILLLEPALFSMQHQNMSLDGEKRDQKPCLDYHNSSFCTADILTFQSRSSTAVFMMACRRAGFRAQ